MSSSIPPATDSSSPTPSDRLWLRSELMGTQVITRDTGRRLGVVGEVVVDIDRREVVALGLRDNPLTRFLPGLPRWMPLASIRQVGDVILVDSADSLSESFDPERYSKVINCQVISESGVQLGRVLGFSFDIETGDLTTLVIGAVGVPLLGEGVLSTWELPVGEIVSSGTDRIIVYEGAEEKLRQLGTGLLEKLGIGGASWEQEERERFRSGVVPAENQLPAGQPSASEQRRIQPATSRAVLPESELDYVELEDRREREPLRQRRYLDEEEEREERWRDPYGASREPRSSWGGDRTWDRPDDAREAGWERGAADRARAAEAARNDADRAASSRYGSSSIDSERDRLERDSDREERRGDDRRRDAFQRDDSQREDFQRDDSRWDERDRDPLAGRGRESRPAGDPERAPAPRERSWSDPAAERKASPASEWSTAAAGRGEDPRDEPGRSPQRDPWQQSSAGADSFLSPRDPEADPERDDRRRDWGTERDPLEPRPAPVADELSQIIPPERGEAPPARPPLELRDRRREARPAAPRFQEAEPIDVEPEVLDDPW